MLPPILACGAASDTTEENRLLVPTSFAQSLFNEYHFRRTRHTPQRSIDPNTTKK
jgi:hypothetical protein